MSGKKMTPTKMLTAWPKCLRAGFHLARGGFGRVRLWAASCSPRINWVICQASIVLF